MSPSAGRRRAAGSTQYGGLIFSFGLCVAILTKLAYVAVRAAIAAHRVAAVARAGTVVVRAVRLAHTAAKVTRLVKAVKNVRSVVKAGRIVKRATGMVKKTVKDQKVVKRAADKIKRVLKDKNLNKQLEMPDMEREVKEAEKTTSKLARQPEVKEKKVAAVAKPKKKKEEEKKKKKNKKKSSIATVTSGARLRELSLNRCRQKWLGYGRLTMRPMPVRRSRNFPTYWK
jgi:outer membrane biosynthesis protein TonB